MNDKESAQNADDDPDLRKVAAMLAQAYRSLSANSLGAYVAIHEAQIQSDIEKGKELLGPSNQSKELFIISNPSPDNWVKQMIENAEVIAEVANKKTTKD